MKKTTKLSKDIPKSQPSITTFFSKPNRSKLQLKKPLVPQDVQKPSIFEKNRDSKETTGGKCESLIEKEGIISHTKRKNEDALVSNKRKLVLLHTEDINNSKSIMNKDMALDIKRSKEALTVNQKVSSLLLKGKYHNNEDQCVPDAIEVADKKNKCAKKEKLLSVVSCASSSEQEVLATDLFNLELSQSQLAAPTIAGEALRSGEVPKPTYAPGDVSLDVLENDSESRNANELDDMFGDEWNIDEIKCDKDIEDLDLTQWQRCEVSSVTTINMAHILKVKSTDSDKRATCYLEGSWRDSVVHAGDIISVVGVQRAGGGYQVDSCAGLLVQWPDTLVSGTAVVGSLFCKRRAVLQDRFKGIDCGSKAMVIGTLVHELLQETLRKELREYNQIKAECHGMLKNLDCIYMLYEADMSVEEAMKEMMKFVPQIFLFINKYVTSSDRAMTTTSSRSSIGNNKMSSDSSEWDGTINKIVDIEENIWSPKLGVKGKVDVTVEVTIHDKQTNMAVKSLMPLELKTGKATVSAEHRGQVILYSMLMTAVATGQQPVSQGLLLYLRESVGIHQIPAGHSEKRDLLILRNQLAYYMANYLQQYTQNPAESANAGPCTSTSTGKKETHPGDELKMMELPEPINHHSACGRCPYSTLCTVYLSKDPSVVLPDGHPLKKIMPLLLSHLSELHVAYFLHWCSLLGLEDAENRIQNPLKDIWTIEASEREKRGKCLKDMVIVEATTLLRDRYEHIFQKGLKNSSQFMISTSLQTGDYIIVSTRDKISISTGSVTHIDKLTISLLLDRDLTKRNSASTLYTLDQYSSQTLMTYNLTNLGVLMEDREVCTKLRRLIVDKEAGQFAEKMPRRIVDLGRSAMAGLNRVQQRAVLRTLAAQDYLLIKGMPGTGKTQTIMALVKLLVALDLSVLITCQTHSAVDNVLLRLVDSGVRMLRLGSSSRVRAELQACCEATLTADCRTSEDLHQVYMNANVVGVTCLGSAHPLLTKRTFDVCIVDESTQVLQCSVLRPLFSSKKFVLVGDPEQLPPIVRSNKARLLGLDESLFARLEGLGCTVSLNVQYRMNQRIMDVANRLSYSDQLQCANSQVAEAVLAVKFEDADYEGDKFWLRCCLSPALDASVVILDTGNTHQLRRTFASGQDEHSKCSNVCEAALTLNIIIALVKAGISKEDIGVIAPYRDQVALLKKIILKHHGVEMAGHGEVEINTVDQYQGRDKHVILYSCTKTWDQLTMGAYKSRDNEILEDKRRLTVAVTRAKHKLIVLGDIATLEAYKPFKELFQSVKPHGETTADCIFNLPSMEKKDQFNWKSLVTY